MANMLSSLMLQLRLIHVIYWTVAEPIEELVVKVR